MTDITQAKRGDVIVWIPEDAEDVIYGVWTGHWARIAIQPPGGGMRTVDISPDDIVGVYSGPQTPESLQLIRPLYSKGSGCDE